jgi:hypothetical protein
MQEEEMFRDDKSRLGMKEWWQVKNSSRKDRLPLAYLILAWIELKVVSKEFEKQVVSWRKGSIVCLTLEWLEVNPRPSPKFLRLLERGESKLGTRQERILELPNLTVEGIARDAEAESDKWAREYAQAFSGDSIEGGHHPSWSASDWFRKAAWNTANLGETLRLKGERVTIVFRRRCYNEYGETLW